jgi:hypothetical protein
VGQNELKFKEMVMLELTLLQFEQQVVGEESVMGVELLNDVLESIERSRLTCSGEAILSFEN